jgi:tRNA-2-methylthio-N6-dimethylallyladenosine synthase
VLFEKPGRLKGQLSGKSDYLHAVHALAPVERLGQVCRVRITESGPNSLGGTLIG